MKKIKLVLSVLLVTVVFMKVVLAGGVDTISVEETLKLQNESKAIIVDVRELSETASGKIKNALVIPISEMEQNRSEWDKKIESFNKDKTIILYCRSGRRAGIVGPEIAKKGFKVFNLGGFDAWKSKGLPTE
jgi:rhodanese-related sulfurtransferase